jgi:hypothetical protein
MGIITFFKKLFKRLFKHGGENNMPAGLQVFNKNGVQIVSLTDRLTKVSGVKRFDVIEESGSATVELSKDQQIWYYLNSYADDNDGILQSLGSNYNIVVEGGKISWNLKAPNNVNKPCKVALIYGVM